MSRYASWRANARVPVPPETRRRLGDLVTLLGLGRAREALRISEGTLKDVVTPGGTVLEKTLARVEAEIARVENEAKSGHASENDTGL